MSSSSEVSNLRAKRWGTVAKWAKFPYHATQGLATLHWPSELIQQSDAVMGNGKDCIVSVQLTATEHGG